MARKKTLIPDALRACAGEAMTGPLLLIKTEDTVRGAAAAFLDRNISGAPVIDRSGRPVGVLTKTDIVRYEREFVALTETTQIREAMRTLGTLELIASGKGFHRETEEDFVAHWMTPKVFAVDQETPLVQVLREMTSRKVHRIFVKASKTGELAGVITTFDLMKFLERVLSAGILAKFGKSPSYSRRRG